MSLTSQLVDDSKPAHGAEPRIAILVLGCLLPVYDRCIKSIRATWGKSSSDTVDIYYVYGGQGANRAPGMVKIEDLIGQAPPQLNDFEAWVSGDIILCGAADIYADQIDCILRKRLIAFGYLANQNSYDFVYTVCASSYVDVDALQRYLRSLPTSGVYHGSVSISKGGAPFVSGSSILMSRDVAADLSNFAEAIVSHNNGVEPDDVAIGRWIAENYCDDSLEEICSHIAAGEKATNNQTFVRPFSRGLTNFVMAPVRNHVPHRKTYHYHFHSRRMSQMEEFHRLYFASSATYSLAPNVEVQDLGLGGESVLVNVESGKIYQTNVSASEILASIASGKSLADASDRLFSKYNIDRATLAREMHLLIHELIENELIVGVEAS